MLYSNEKIGSEIAKGAALRVSDLLAEPGGVGAIVFEVSESTHMLVLMAHGDGHLRSSHVMSDVRELSLLLLEMMGGRAVSRATSFMATQIERRAAAQNDCVECYEFILTPVEGLGEQEQEAA